MLISQLLYYIERIKFNDDNDDEVVGPILAFRVLPFKHYFKSSKQYVNLCQ